MHDQYDRLSHPACHRGNMDATFGTIVVGAHGCQITGRRFEAETGGEPWKTDISLGGACVGSPPCRE